MKVRCKNCGEIFESGMESLARHVTQDCKDVRIEPVYRHGTNEVLFYAQHRKSMNVEAVEEEKRQDHNGFWLDYYTP